MIRARALMIGATVAAMLCTGCAGPTDMDKVTLRIAVYPGTVSAGDTVQIVVSVYNVTNEDLFLTFDTDCQLLYQIVGASGTQVAPTQPWFCTQGRTSIVLSSFEQRESAYTWVAQVPAGAYRAYGVLGAEQTREAGPALLTVQ